MAIEPHVAKWWDIANERRFRLIKKEHLGSGLTKKQEVELMLLQHVTDLFLSYAAPMDFSHLEALERKVARLSKAIAKASLKAKKAEQKAKGQP